MHQTQKVKEFTAQETALKDEQQMLSFFALWVADLEMSSIWLLGR